MDSEQTFRSDVPGSSALFLMAVGLEGKIWTRTIRVPRRHLWLQAIWVACSSDR